MHNGSNNIHNVKEEIARSSFELDTWLHFIGGLQLLPYMTIKKYIITCGIKVAVKK